MCHRPLFIAFILLHSNYLHRTESAAPNIKNLPNVMTNCTVDDLHNINEQYRNSFASHSVNYKFLHCNLVAIPDAVFINLSSLRSLEFCTSKIITLRSNALDGLLKLESLRIVDNPNLTQLNLWSADNLDNLLELDLHANGIKVLDYESLLHYRYLKHLNLQRNAITHIPVEFLSWSSNLETLNLAENSIQRIESDTFKALFRLADLNLAYNRIDYIDEYAFSTTILLDALRLNGNQIKTISSMVFFNLHALEYLNLSENALNAYDALGEDAFKQNVNLVHLDMSHNPMFSIASNALRGLHSLQVLNLSSNHLTSVSLPDFHRLKHLDMSYNKLSQLLDNQFPSMRSIECLNISHNRLNSIQPFTFADSHPLEILDLSSNRLHTDDFLDSATPINLVDLRNNAYEKINLTALNSIGQIFLGNNQWNCTWLLNAMANLENVATDIHFGVEFSDGTQSQNQTKSKIEELDCYDYRKSVDHPSIRRVFVVNFSQFNNRKNLANNQKKRPSIFTYPRTFNKLLSDEFDYKACLLWTVVAVCMVIGLVRLGKYCLNESEKKSERYRKIQQEKVLKDIDEYFAKNIRRQQRS